MDCMISFTSCCRNSWSCCNIRSKIRSNNGRCSVRIPRQVGTDGKGCLEDRRPSSNCDPYVVTAAIASDVLLDKEN
jgi:glutamine synthetase